MSVICAPPSATPASSGVQTRRTLRASGGNVLLVKGAAESLLERSTQVQHLLSPSLLPVTNMSFIAYCIGDPPTQKRLTLHCAFCALCFLCSVLSVLRIACFAGGHCRTAY